MKLSFRRIAVPLVALLCALVAGQVVQAAAPVADFTISDDTPLTGQLVSFNSTSTDDEDDITSTEWDFEYNGSTFDVDATGNSPSHIYLTPGSRSVAIRVTDTTDVDSTVDQVIATHTVTVGLNSPPNAVLSAPSSAGVGQTVNFSGSGSTDSDGAIVKYEWDLDGNGSYETDTGLNANTTQSYATPGVRNIKLKVTDNLGATATDSANLVISNAAPHASFSISPNPAAVGQVVTFNGSGSSDSDGTISKYEWDLDGDGVYETDTAGNDTTSQAYSTGGTRTIRLRVTDDDGAVAVDSDTLFVSNTRPNASFTVAPNPAQIGATVTFNASASNDPDPGGSIVKYEWDLDGLPGYEVDAGGSPTTTQSYMTPGTRTIRLRVTDDDGATATDADSLRINAKPTPSFTISPNPAVIDETVTFNANTSSDSDGTITQYEWDLDGNGSYDVSGPTAIATRSYATEGERTIKLRVTDNNGAQSELTRPLAVQLTRPNAGFSFAPQAPVPGQAIAFTSQSSPSTSPGNPVIVSTQWDFNYDPTKEFTPDASGTSATTSFPSAGRKLVAIKVTETGGGFAIATAPVVVNAPPQASFSIAPAAPLDGDSLTLSSTSSDPDGPLGEQQWDLDGDGQYDDASGAVVARAYDTGGHIVRLRVTDARGAVATAARNINVLKRPPKFLTGVKVTLFGNLTRSGVRLKRLVVRTPGKATAKISCRGRKCPRAARAASKRPVRTARLRFTRFERSFPAGTVITVTVTRPGYIGQKTTIKVRGQLRRYIRKDRCLPPGGGKPVACPAS
jgi:large repetitive protein